MRRAASSLILLCLLVWAPAAARAATSATTGDATDITPTSALVSGTGSYTGGATFVFSYFSGQSQNVRYSPVFSYTGAASATPMAFRLTNLTPSTTYTYVLSGTDANNGAVNNGPARTFTTAAAQASPTLPVPAALPLTQSPPRAAPPEKADPAPPAAASNTPRIRESVGVSPTRGTVLVRRPGGGFSVLRQGDVIPVGSVVDTTRGSVTLSSALPGGKTQTGQFSGGVFQLRQSRDGTVDLFLRGPISCPAKSGRLASISAKRKGRRLFGRDKGGKFRTHGKHSQATVRGTRWLVEDRCNGTLTKVTEGAVAVRDFAKKRTILVKAGGRYLARPRR